MHDVQRISELVVPRFAARSRATFGSLDCEMFKRACGWIRFNCCFAMHVRRARNTNMLIPSFFYVDLTLSPATYIAAIYSLLELRIDRFVKIDHVSLTFATYFVANVVGIKERSKRERERAIEREREDRWHGSMSARVCRF